MNNEYKQKRDQFILDFVTDCSWEENAKQAIDQLVAEEARKALINVAGDHRKHWKEETDPEFIKGWNGLRSNILKRAQTLTPTLNEGEHQ